MPLKTGGFKVATTPLVKQLMVTAEEAELIKVISVEVETQRKAQQEMVEVQESSELDSGRDEETDTA